MRISTRGRYSLEAMLYIALLPTDQLVSTRIISEQTGISDGYLEQLFIPLKKAGFIIGVRGAQGGYYLGKSPEDITVGDILRVVEGPLIPVPCLESKDCASLLECKTRYTWGELYKEIHECIDAIYLSSLVSACRQMEEEEAV